MLLASKKPTGDEMVYIVLYNPHSGRRRFHPLKRIQRYLSVHNCAYFLYDYTQASWDEIKKQLIPNHTRIIIAGGDGTLRHVLEQIWKQQLTNYPVAFVPLGTANLVAFSLKLPMRIESALKRAIHGKVHPIDLGVINNTHAFFLAASFGFISEVSVQPSRALKKYIGGLAYWIYISRFLWTNYAHHAFTVHARMKGRTKSIPFRTHTVGVCNHLNAYIVSPEYDVLPDDGMLDLIFIQNRHFFGFLKALYSFYIKKTKGSNFIHIQTPSVELSFEDFKGSIQLDGDPVDIEGPLYTVTTLKHVLKFIR